MFPRPHLCIAFQCFVHARVAIELAMPLRCICARLWCDSRMVIVHSDSKASKSLIIKIKMLCTLSLRYKNYTAFLTRLVSTSPPLKSGQEKSEHQRRDHLVVWTASFYILRPFHVCGNCRVSCMHFNGLLVFIHLWC